MTTRRLHGDQGLSTLEKLGVLTIIVTVLAFIPVARHAMGDVWDSVFKQTDEAGHLTSFSLAAKGILITVVSLVAFVGSGWMVLSTNLGRRLGFLITGAATFGWLVIGSMLFVVYAPRGLRPRDLAGLNAWEMRVPSIAMTLASLILFLMFIVALDNYEREGADAA
jgi:hypothetical protein